MTESANPEVIVYMPPNKLKEKVTLNGRIKGNGYDAVLLARANANVAAMRGKFLEAVGRDVASLERLRGELKRDPRDALFAELEKIAHEITGYGTTIGFDLLTRFGRSLSLFLRKTDIEGTVKLNVARAHVDSMVLVYRTPIKGQGGTEGDTLTSMLNLTIAKFVAEP